MDQFFKDEGDKYQNVQLWVSGLPDGERKKNTWKLVAGMKHVQIWWEVQENLKDGIGRSADILHWEGVRGGMRITANFLSETMWVRNWNKM